MFLNKNIVEEEVGFMVAGISSGINSYLYLFDGGQASNNFGESFENIINDVQSGSDLISVEDVQYLDSSQSEKKSNDMDLNKDGVITIDEIMKYMELQEQENIKEGLETSAFEGENNGRNNNPFFPSLKTPMKHAINAYSAFC